MKLQKAIDVLPAGLVLILAVAACNLQRQPAAQPPAQATEPQATEPATELPTVPSTETPTPIPTVTHVMTPGEPKSGKTVYDAESQSTAPELRAPYGDSYDINRLERPFTKDMIYVSDLDLYLYRVSSDTNWWYVHVETMGTNPNLPLGINYGVELDKDHDGFGDLLVLAHAPITQTWDTLPVQVFQDTNHDTGGLSAEKSDAPIDTDGYDTLLFNGGRGDPDPDLAFVRLTTEGIQFAFKKSWSGSVFMLGVFADAGLKDPKQLDYVDRFEESEAGSPVRDKKYYPLGALHLVDNICREAFGFKPNGFEPQLCPYDEPAPPRPGKTPGVCPEPDPGDCTIYYPYPVCECIYIK